MLTSGFDATWLLLLGRSSLRALGLTRVDVMRKNISNKKIMSVIDDILNEGSTFALRLKAILFSIYLPVRVKDP